MKLTRLLFTVKQCTTDRTMLCNMLVKAASLVAFKNIACPLQLENYWHGIAAAGPNGKPVVSLLERRCSFQVHHLLNLKTF